MEQIRLFVDNDLPSISLRLHPREGFYGHEWMDEWDYRYNCFAEPISEKTAKRLANWGKSCGLESDSSYGDVGWYIGFYRSLAVHNVEL